MKDNPLDVISDINKIKNKIKRNDDYIKDKKEITDELSKELEQLNKQYYEKTANETYITLSDLISLLGEDVVEKVAKKLRHISDIKDDGKWVQSKIPCWVCELNNHNCICYDNKTCDRGLEKCVGTRISLIQVKQQDQGELF